MIQEVDNSLALQKQRIIKIIAEYLKFMNFKKTVNQIQKETLIQQIKQELKIDEEMVDQNEQNDLIKQKQIQKQIIRESCSLQEQKEIQKQSISQNNTSNLLIQKSIQQKDILSLFNHGGSFLQLLNQCQTLLTNQSETKNKQQDQRLQIPKLLRIVQCSWGKLIKYKLPIYKTMRIQCNKKIAFLKMCPLDSFCCVVDEDNTIRLIDVEKRQLRQEKKLKYDGQNQNNRTIITAIEWISWESFMIGDNKGNLSVFNPISLKAIDQYKKLHDSQIVTLACFDGYFYSCCSFDKILKKVKKNFQKQFICSGYCKLLKSKAIDNYIIGLDQHRKNIYIFDEVTQKQTLLYSLQNKNKRIGAVQVGYSGKLLVAIQKGYPQIYQIQISTRKIYKRVKIQKQKSHDVSIAQLYNGNILAISISNNKNIQYYSIKNWNMIYQHIGQNQKNKKSQKYRNIANAQKERLIYANGKWIQILDIQKLDLIQRKIKKEPINSFFSARNLRDSPALFSLFQNFQYQNLF